MIKYSRELEEQGFFVQRYEDRFFWDTPENLSKYPWGTKDGWEKEETNPVLGGKFGTCFDLSVMKDENMYKMWFCLFRKSGWCALERAHRGVKTKRGFMVG